LKAVLFCTMHQAMGAIRISAMRCYQLTMVQSGVQDSIILVFLTTRTAAHMFFIIHC